MTQPIRYAFIGAGKMAQGIIAGMLKAGIAPEQIIASTQTKASSERLQAQWAIATTQNNNDCLDADVIVLAIKPQQLIAVLEAFDPQRLQPENALWVSVIAGVPCSVYQSRLGERCRLVRTMPNMPSKIGLGMTGLYAKHCTDTDKTIAEQMMQTVGRTLWVSEEAGIDYVNAISGSGPAYVYGFIHHLASAGERLGLSYQAALTLAMQTVLGATQMVEQSGANSPDAMQHLIAEITSKGGTTFEAMQSFERDQFGEVVNRAVQCCYQRAVELGEENQL